MDVYVRNGGLVQLGDHSLGQPDGIALQEYADAVVAILRLVDNDLTNGARGFHLAHTVTSASISAISVSMVLRSASISSSGRGGMYR